ncbi:hypothetical protein [uncultured Zoogloea sp.]|uniref:hypothetical protein n=1 Tax=uncultured Zoogloea sp. TaxID=160237 RepID=UPI00261BBB2D|nr:hypothetical protein [uncultured Zoogloea sp.]
MTPLQRANLEYQTLARTGGRLRAELARTEAAALAARNRVFEIEEDLFRAALNAAARERAKRSASA